MTSLRRVSWIFITWAIAALAVAQVAAQEPQAEGGAGISTWVLLIATFGALGIGYALGRYRSLVWWVAERKCDVACSCTGPDRCPHGAAHGCGYLGCAAGEPTPHTHCTRRQCSAGCGSGFICTRPLAHAGSHLCPHGHPF